MFHFQVRNSFFLFGERGAVGGLVVLLDEARIFLVSISISNQNIGKSHITLNQYGY